MKTTLLGGLAVIATLTVLCATQVTAEDGTGGVVVSRLPWEDSEPDFVCG